ncbi:Chromosome partition protein Smc [Carpediemonas membranifera]|uniref:Chromosome partition protein Smc n=1 Tax=Carpediemonas membranifera TaxID=201153 RepID=A0A8J6B498_9EUKA|nr:Chromosome partition protein Smc [Carpediemonas membranifera]|eukprot:KAG9392684.1 Chromosome partition protein Smc [Carpediemonas membranifera]
MDLNALLGNPGFSSDVGPTPVPSSDPGQAMEAHDQYGGHTDLNDSVQQSPANVAVRPSSAYSAPMASPGRLTRSALTPADLGEVMNVSHTPEPSPRIPTTPAGVVSPRTRRSRVSDLQRQREHLAEQLDEVETQLHSIAPESDTSKMSALVESNAALQAEISTLKRKVGEAECKVEQSSSALHASRLNFDEERSGFRSESDALRSEIASLRSRLETEARRNSDLLQRTVTLNRAVEASQAAVDVHGVEVAEKDALIEKLFGILAKQREETLIARREADMKMNDLRAAFSTGRAGEIAGLVRALERVRAAIASSSAGLTQPELQQSVDATVASLRQTVDGLRAEGSEQSRLVCELTNALREVQAELAEYKDGRPLLERDALIGSLKAVIVEHEKREASLMGGKDAAEEKAKALAAREAMLQETVATLKARPVERPQPRSRPKNPQKKEPTPAPVDTAAEEKYRRQRETFERLRDDNARLRARLTKLQRGYDALKAEHEQASVKVSRFQKVAEERVGTIRRLEADLKAQSAKLERAYKKMEEIQPDHDKTLELKSKVALLESELGDTRMQSTRRVEDSASLEAENKRLRDSLALTETELRRREAFIPSFGGMKEVQALNSRIVDEASTMGSAIDGLHARVREEQERYAALAIEHAQCETRIRKADEAVKAAEAKVRAAQDKVKEAEGRAQKALGHVVELSRGRDLQKAQQSQVYSNAAGRLEEENARLKDLLQRKDKILLNLRNEMMLRGDG